MIATIFAIVLFLVGIVLFDFGAYLIGISVVMIALFISAVDVYNYYRRR